MPAQALRRNDGSKGQLRSDGFTTTRVRAGGGYQCGPAILAQADKRLTGSLISAYCPKNMAARVRVRCPTCTLR